jgi:hypothetical protein
VAEERDAVEVERIPHRELRGERQRAADVLDGRRPAAADVADAPVLDVPRRDPARGEVDAEVSRVDQVPVRLPVAAVDDDEEGERTAARGQAQVAELQRLRAVDEPRVRRRRRRVGEDVVAVPGHRAILVARWR